MNFGFTLEKADSVQLYIGDNAQIDYIEWSIDNGTTWVRKQCKAHETIVSGVSETILFRGKGCSLDSCHFSVEQTCEVWGDISLLTDGNIGERCYKGLFREMKSLVSTLHLVIPSVMTNECCAEMFYHCTSLRRPPSLPATTLAPSCYKAMFYGCESLISAPVLPALELATECYMQMFYGCMNMRSIPQLPATTLAPSCYKAMFYGCTRLSSAPHLPAITLSCGCYVEMFYGCTNISRIEAAFINEPVEMYTKDWLTGVSEMGEFVRNQIADWTKRCSYGIPKKWSILYKNALTINPCGIGTLTIHIPGNCKCLRSLSYTTDGHTWIVKNNNQKDMTIDIPLNGCTVWIVGQGTGTSSGGNMRSSVSISCDVPFNISGSIMSLCGDYTDSVKNLADDNISFAYLFKDCTTLINANIKLPATVLSVNAYRSMFEGCTSLVTGPHIPAMTLAPYCYCNMFKGCVSLVKLSMQTAFGGQYSEIGCFAGMFNGCVNLTEAPSLSPGILPHHCMDMYKGCVKI